MVMIMAAGLLNTVGDLVVTTVDDGVVYKSLVESVLTFNIVVWYGKLVVKGKAKMACIVGMAGKIVGAKQDSLSDLYLTAVERKTAQILDDAKHPLFSQFQKLQSGRQYKVPIARKNV